MNSINEFVLTSSDTFSPLLEGTNNGQVNAVVKNEKNLENANKSLTLNKEINLKNNDEKGVYLAGYEVQQLCDGMIINYSAGITADWSLLPVGQKQIDLINKYFSGSQLIANILQVFPLKKENKHLWITEGFIDIESHTYYKLGFTDRNKNYKKVCMKVYAKCNGWENVLLVKSDTFFPLLHILRAYAVLQQDLFPNTAFELSNYLSFIEKLINVPILNLIKCLKYFTATPLAHFLKNAKPELPEFYPSGHFILFSGKLKLFLKSFLVQNNNPRYYKVSLKLWFAFLQGIKRAAQVVPEIFIVEGYKSHAKILEKLKQTDQGMIEIFSELLTDMTEQVRPKQLLQQIYDPSKNAHFDSSFSVFGAAGYYIRTIQDPYFEDYVYYSHKLVVQTNIIDEDITEVEYHLKEGTTLPSVAELRELIVKMYLPRFDYSSGELYTFQHDNLEQDQPKLKTMVYELAEPLKVRAITKAESLPSWYSKMFQKHMKNYINRFWQFILTKEPLQIAHLNQLEIKHNKLSEEHIVLRSFTKFVSGDYSAATDNIKSSYTRKAFEHLLSSYFSYTDGEVDMFNTITDRNIFRSVLYETEISYPTYTGIEPIIQRNGQLMGSILSFPILCLINLLTYAAALAEYINIGVLEENHVKLNLADLPVLVNGDDILFKCNDEFYLIWKKWIEEAGFHLSIGKNYVHSKVLTINSQCFLYDKDTHNFSNITYLNVGLLIGQSKNGPRSSEENIPLSDWYNTIMMGSTSKQYIHNSFLHYHSDRVKEATNSGDFNLFIPKLLGGLGCFHYDEIPLFITPFQNNLATFLSHYLVDAQTSIKNSKVKNFRSMAEKDKHVSNIVISSKIEFQYFLLFSPIEIGFDIYTGYASPIAVNFSTQEEEELYFSSQIKNNTNDYDLKMFNAEEMIEKSPYEGLTYKDPKRILNKFRRSGYNSTNVLNKNFAEESVNKLVTLHILEKDVLNFDLKNIKNYKIFNDINDDLDDFWGAEGEEEIKGDKNKNKSYADTEIYDEIDLNNNIIYKYFELNDDSISFEQFKQIYMFNLKFQMEYI
jgi:hypothetical protein